jgi:phytoene synthase
MAIFTRNPQAGAIAEVTALARSAGGPDAWPAYFAHHAKTFRLAARLFPAAEAELVAGVYAFCRFTDDLVDEPHDAASDQRVRERLTAWTELTARAHGGEITEIPLLDEVLGEARRRGVSWKYPEALLEGVGMDLTVTRYPDWRTLERYTFCVAGAVGGWLTQLFGLHDPELLDQAHALGHGMQITNIVRDVGEDWARDRVYVPETLLAGHGLTADDIGRLARTQAPMPGAYVEMTEALIQAADAYYERAWPGIRALPGFFRRPVAAAAAAYRGIHREVRKNGYDNLRHRAHTSTVAKLVLAAGGLIRSRF